MKQNQKRLYKIIEGWFYEIDIYGNKIIGKGHIPEGRYRYSITEEQGSEMKEKRICQVYNNGILPEVLKWEGANSVVCLTRSKIDKETEETVSEKRYYITSLPLDSDHIMDTIRSHWSIENNLHWQLDVTFNEDSQKKKENAVQNFSMLSKIALT